MPSIRNSQFFSRVVTVDTVTCKSKLLEDGHLALPKSVQKALGLRVGEPVELVVRKVLPSVAFLEKTLMSAINNPDTPPEQIEQLIEQLTAQASPGQCLLQAVKAVADSKLPASKQRVLTRLLNKNSAGTLTNRDKQQLDALISEVELGTLRKAHGGYALYLLQGGKPHVLPKGRVV